MGNILSYKTGTVTIPNFELESGERFDAVQLAYERCGHPEHPVILICHALTGNQYAVGTNEEPGWWRNLICEGGYIDLEQYQVITFNVLGGCDGSTGPLSYKQDQVPYNNDFPQFTIRDLVEVQFVALNLLGIDHLKAVIGGSLGGMQVLEWGLMYPNFMEAIFPLAVTAQFSDYAIAFNHIAKQTIMLDSGYKRGEHPESGLSLARMIGMITYRTDELFNKRFARADLNGEYDVASYLNYQGEKFAQRFNVYSYLKLLEAMNGHDIVRNRGNYQKVIQQYRAPIFAIGFKGDLLYPPKELHRLVIDVQESGGYAEFFEIDTQFGHDGFLVEFEKWGQIIKDSLTSLTAKAV